MAPPMARGRREAETPRCVKQIRFLPHICAAQAGTGRGEQHVTISQMEEKHVE